MSVISSPRTVFHKAGQLFLAVSLAMFVIMTTVVNQVSAVDYPKLNNRSLILGSTIPGESTDWTFSWRWPTNTSVGSIRFLLCADAYVEEPCASTPPGDMSAAILASQTGTLGGFTILSQSANEIILSRVSAGNTGTGQYTFAFDDVINPTSLEHRFFVQLFTYTSTNATGTANHMSSVTNSTANPIMINSEVPQILYFCAALTIDTWCENVSGNYIDYGDLTPAIEDAAISQFGVATNAENGYVVTINGNTMASGNKLINALSIPTANTPGVSQFGLNLRANTNPANGLDPSGVGIGTVTANYNTPDLFHYSDGDVVASAFTGSMFNIFTVTYIVNVPPDQPSGVYNTTIAYICTAGF